VEDLLKLGGVCVVVVFAIRLASAIAQMRRGASTPDDWELYKCDECGVLLNMPPGTMAIPCACGHKNETTDANGAPLNRSS
jgi:hypothetical protein